MSSAKSFPKPICLHICPVRSHSRERTGEIFTRVEFDREEKQAYALEVEARDGAASARPNANGRPNTGTSTGWYFPLVCRVLNVVVPLFSRQRVCQKVVLLWSTAGVAFGVPMVFFL